MATYRTRRLRRARLYEHLMDATIGAAIGAPLALLGWLATLWYVAR